MVNRLWAERILVLFPSLLLISGVVMVYSASSIIADKRFGDSFFFLKRHLVYAVLSILVMTVTAKIDYQHIRKVTYPVLLFSFVLLVIVLIPSVGVEVGGATRWLRIGLVSVQPSEFAKLAVIFYLAASFTRKKDEIKDFKKGFLPYMAILAVFLAPILLQPDFGTAVTIAGIMFIMLFVAGTRFSYIFGLILSMLPFVYMLIAGVEYRKKRILSFIDPWNDPQDTGFQIIQSFIAFGAGGVFGRGLGEGRQKLFYLPEPHTDFILPVIGEELGFIGVAAIVLLFVCIVIMGIRAAFKSRDPFGCHLALGIISMIAIQALINMGVVLGLLPTKGLTLPFLSYGGTSLIVNMTGVGILLSITARGRD